MRGNGYHPPDGAVNGTPWRAADTSRGRRRVEPVENIEVENTVVACDGGNGPLGHPCVYLNMGDRHDIDCPYCGRRFFLKTGAKAGSGH
ncbi:MAG: zinc-finger domain-containing protein [Alphaproteobacteria bacterium]|nr:zinc-finger domain-containing protein [Alphaproteobacteria bacterium]